MKTFSLVVLLGVLASASAADGDFGTREEAQSLADELIEIVSNEGVGVAIDAMHDPELPFRSSRMGVNLFSGSMIVADNREPEMVALDYAGLNDLAGRMMWPVIVDAAQLESDAELRWYHYDTQEQYDYKCFAKASETTDVIVMVCR